MSRVRCDWAKNELNIPYHDEEWGVPVHDERKWFEFLILEGAQAGLSWMENPQTPPCKNSRIRCSQQGFTEARISFRWIDHLLRFHASHGAGQRSPGELFPVSRFVEMSVRAGLACVEGGASLR